MITLAAQDKALRFLIPEDDHIAKVISETGKWYEQGMLDDILSRHPVGTAIDVGACFGTHAAWLSAVCGMKVIALEPNSYTFELLNANIELNSLDVQAMRAAAGNRCGAVKVEASRLKDNIGATPVTVMPRSATGVPMVTIDSLGIDDVGLIKIDTEGMEIRVLQGAEETIKRCKPLIYVEAGRTYRDVTDLMLSYGYRQFGRFNKTATYGFAPITANVSPGEMATLSVAVMAHHKRDRFIPYLKERLGDVDVIWDQKNDRWDTGRRAMLAFNPNASHHMVVQDDAIIPRDFIASVEAAIQTVPDNPISFYAGQARPNHQYVEYMVKRALEAGVPWIAMEGPWWGPAVVVPTSMIPEMIEWCDKRDHIPNYDRRLSRFFLSKNIECYYSVPSLVSHRTGEDNPSLVPGRGSSPGRVAFNFIGEDESALKMQWSPAAVRPDRRAPRKVSP